MGENVKVTQAFLGTTARLRKGADCFSAGLRRQNWYLVTLMLVLGLLPIYNNGFGHPGLFYLAALTGLATVCAALFPACRQTRPLEEKLLVSWRLDLPYMVYLAAGLVSLAWSIDQHQTMLELLNLGLYFLVYRLVAERLPFREGRRLEAFLLVAGTMVGAVGVLLFLFISPGRIASTFVNSNPFGIYMTLLAVVALGNLADAWRPASVLAAVVTVDALVLSGSRGSTAAGLVALALLWLALPVSARSRALSRWAVVGVVAAGSLAAVFALAPLLQGLGDASPGLGSVLIRSDSFTGSSLEGRLSFWRVALKMIADRPWTGVGLGNYHSAYMFYRNDDFWYSRYTHNHYLQTWAELGPVALAGFVLFFALLSYRAWRFRPRGDGAGSYAGLMAAGLGFLVHLAVDFSWNMPAVTATFWALLGLLVGRMGAISAGAVSNGCPLPAGGDLDMTQVAVIGIGNGLKPRRNPAMVFLAVFVVALSVQQLLAMGLAGRGDRAASAHEWAKATGIYEVVVGLDPLNPLWQSHLADLYGERLAAGEAPATGPFLAAGQRAVRLSPWNGVYHLQLALIYTRLARPELAEAEFRAAVRYAGYDPRPSLELGTFLLSQYRPVEAAAVFGEALERLPFALRNAPTTAVRNRIAVQGADSRLALARSYQELGRYREAEQELRQVLAEYPGHPVALRELRRSEQGSGQAQAGP